MKKLKTMWIRHDYNTGEPIAVADSYDNLAKKRKDNFLKKQGKDECVYIREYVELKEGEIQCPREEWKPDRYKFCPHCGKKLVYRDEDLCLNGGI